MRNKKNIKLFNDISGKTKKVILFFMGINLCAILINAQSIIFLNAKKNFNEGNYEDSKNLFNTIGKNTSEYGESRYYLGRIFFSTRNFDESIEYFQEAIAANNKNADYYFWLGNSYGEKAMLSNMVEQAFLAKKILKNWETGVKLDSTHQGLRWGLMNFYSQAPSIMGGNMEKAYKAADELNKLRYPDGFEAKGYVYERDKKKEMAEKSFKEAINASPKELKFYYALAYFYLRQNKINESIELFVKIIDINPQEANAHFEMGRLYSSNNKMLDQGKEHLTRYLQMADPNNKNGISKAYYYLGNIYKSQGDKTNAKKHYEKALSLDPTFIEAKHALEKL